MAERSDRSNAPIPAAETDDDVVLRRATVTQPSLYVRLGLQGATALFVASRATFFRGVDAADAQPQLVAQGSRQPFVGQSHAQGVPVHGVPGAQDVGAVIDARGEPAGEKASQEKKKAEEDGRQGHFFVAVVPADAVMVCGIVRGAGG